MIKAYKHYHDRYNKQKICLTEGRTVDEMITQLALINNRAHYSQRKLPYVYRPGDKLLLELSFHLLQMQRQSRHFQKYQKVSNPCLGTSRKILRIFCFILFLKRGVSCCLLWL